MLGNPGIPSYIASKHGVIGLTLRVLRKIGSATLEEILTNGEMSIQCIDRSITLYESQGYQVGK